MIETSQVAEFGVWYVVFLFSLTLHEGAHALLARLGGDDTAYLGGQVTLNPLPHIRREPIGTVMMPILSFFMARWMMGWASTPFDPAWARRRPRAQALMSAAGPAANLLIAAGAFFVLRSLLGQGVLIRPGPDAFGIGRLAQPAGRFGESLLLEPAAMALSVALSLNVLLFLFNLLPIPPLDGSGVLQGLFPDGAGRLMESLSGTPMIGLLGMLAAWQMLDYVSAPVHRAILELLYR